MIRKDLTTDLVETQCCSYFWGTAMVTIHEKSLYLSYYQCGYVIIEAFGFYAK